jgi:HSP20 family protein
LTADGQRKPTQAEGATWHRRERAAGPFDRVVTLPVEVDANRVEARLQNGVLTARFPKAEVARARKIDVKAG